MGYKVLIGSSTYTLNLPN